MQKEKWLTVMKKRKLLEFIMWLEKEKHIAFFDMDLYRGVTSEKAGELFDEWIQKNVTVCRQRNEKQTCIGCPILDKTQYGYHCMAGFKVKIKGGVEKDMLPR